MNRRFAARILLAGLAPLASAAAAAAPFQAYTWRNLAIHGGGYVTGLVYHPSEPDLLYARTDVGGAYRWDAARRAWRPITDIFSRAGGDSDLDGVLSLALDPRDPDKVYLACGEYTSERAHPAAVLWSADRGRTWGATALPFRLGANEDGRGAGERLAVDPHDGRVLFLGTSRDGLWASTDAGRHWRAAGGLPGRQGITFVLFDAASGADGRPTPVIYAGLAEGAGPALFRSADGGGTWAPVAGQPAGLLVQHAALSGGALYLAAGNGLGPNGVTGGAVWRFQPAAGRWRDVTPVRPAGADRFGYAGLAADPARPGTLFVSTLDRWARGDEIFRTEDGGASWVPLLAASSLDPAGTPYVSALRPHWISDLALDPRHPGRLWFVTGYGVWTTEQARADVSRGERLSWAFADSGLEETVVDELVSPAEGAPLLSAVGDLGGFRHEDFAASPAAGMFRPFAGGCPGLSAAAGEPRRMVRTDQGPTRGAVSDDGGLSWRNFGSAPAEAREFGAGIAAIAADGRRIVWLPKGSGPFYSDDDGSSWRRSRAALVSTRTWKTYGPVADPANPRRFYLYDPLSGAFYASADGGESFGQTAALPAGGGLLRAEPGAEGRLWLPLEGGLRLSEDGGRTFRPLPGVATAYQVGFGAPAPGARRPAVYLDGEVGGVGAFFRSDDGGRTWVRISDERIRLGYIRTLAGDPRAYGRIYVGTSGRGIFVGEPAAAAR
ncbi:MAG TPA: xyloglucanase [Opitutaceae bacterium]|nr:xyloglucanase [Opitutaceae bacterium]